MREYYSTRDREVETKISATRSWSTFFRPPLSHNITTSVGIACYHTMGYPACFVPAYSPLPSSFRGNPAALPYRLTKCGRPTHIPICRTRMQPRQLVVARTQAATELEDELMECLRTLQESAGDAGVHRYRTLEPDRFVAAAAAVRALEQSTGGFGGGGGKLRALLPGTWELVLTDSAAVEKNEGSITGLGSLPGAKCKRVKVELRQDGKARTVEGIEVFAGLMKGENALVGKWRVAGKGGRTLEVTYANALLMGKVTVRADSKAVLETTYCSERLRIGRSKGAEFYLFVRNNGI